MNNWLPWIFIAVFIVAIIAGQIEIARLRPRERPRVTPPGYRWVKWSGKIGSNTFEDCYFLVADASDTDSNPKEEI